MGYDVCLVKPERPGLGEEAITEAEWRAFQEQHAAVDYVYFSTGGITCKNPSEEQLLELAKLACERGWRLRGDDGEYYDERGQVIPEPPRKRSVFKRIKDMFTPQYAAPDIAAYFVDVESVFKVGDRVKFLHRTGGVVIKVDKAGNSGLGEIRVKFPDGAILSGVFPDGGFEPEP